MPVRYIQIEGYYVNPEHIVTMMIVQGIEKGTLCLRINTVDGKTINLENWSTKLLEGLVNAIKERAPDYP